MAELPQTPFAIHFVLKKLISTDILELRSGLWWGQGTTSFMYLRLMLTPVFMSEGDLNCWLFTLITL